ncbi:MAG: benzoyl-CoA-dihydrodiol lyase [Pseudomonadales bacterium]|nr:benzoyl-CoA-dihydrodiol lyase [Pseudomonadales bacterium]
MTRRLDFQTHPDRYRHWRLRVEPPFAYLLLDVDEAGGWFEGYQLKLNSYDIGVDIELADAVQRLRFEHPDVRAVLLGSARSGTFCAGANIRMLAGASHEHKVNFCKFTNETRNSIEDATRLGGQIYVAALNGTAAGGGYELALAAERILLIDDGKAAVSLPEVPLLAVLPGTGGLTRVVDKRRVRRDIADVFCTLEEGMQGRRAVEARLVDEAIPGSRFEARCQEVMAECARLSMRGEAGGRVVLEPLEKRLSGDAIDYRHVRVTIDRDACTAGVTLLAPDDPSVPVDIAAAVAQGSAFWPLALMRELDDALLELRFNETAIGTLLLRTQGDPSLVLAYDALLNDGSDGGFLAEVRLLVRQVLSRLDLTSRSLFALLEPGSCFAGFLAELAFAADRAYMLEGQFEDMGEVPPATLTLTAGNFGAYPMVNGLSRLAVRFLGEPDSLTAAKGLICQSLLAADAAGAGLVTVAMDDIDWDEELRLALEERTGFSPDALTGMEANLRFAGPETMQSKIFARLSAWQNWIFQRPNAVGDNGALKRYGTGKRPEFGRHRV